MNEVPRGIDLRVTRRDMSGIAVRDLLSSGRGGVCGPTFVQARAQILLRACLKFSSVLVQQDGGIVELVESVLLGAAAAGVAEASFLVPGQLRRRGLRRAHGERRWREVKGEKKAWQVGMVGRELLAGKWAWQHRSDCGRWSGGGRVPGGQRL